MGLSPSIGLMDILHQTIGCPCIRDISNIHDIHRYVYIYICIVHDIYMLYIHIINAIFIYVIYIMCIYVYNYSLRLHGTFMGLKCAA